MTVATARARFLAVLVVIALPLVACGTSPGATSRPVGPPTVGPVSPSVAPALSEAVIASIPLDHAGCETAAGAGAVWVRSFDGSVTRIDPATNAAVTTIPVGRGEYGKVAVGEGGVWVTTFDDDKLSRIDPETNRVVAEITVGTNPEGIAFTPGAVWVSNHRAGSVSRIDPATNAVVATVTFGRAGASGPKSFAIAAGDVWTPVPNISAVVRIDPETNEVVETLPFASVDAVVSDGDRVFVHAGVQISEVDPGTNSVVRTFDLENELGAFGLASFWAMDGQDLLRLDSDSLEPVASWRVLETPAEHTCIALGEESIWLLPVNQHTLVRVDPER